METYFLIDGAMVHDRIAASRHFMKAGAPWLAALTPLENDRVNGPFLIAGSRLPKGDGDHNEEAIGIERGFPCRLHLSLVTSDWAFDALAEHLRAFFHFGDSRSQWFGLRIADCRVLAYLSRVLTPRQWDALTAPMDEWVIHDRAGTKCALPLNEARLQCTGTPATLRLSDEQIEALIDAGEPDALLAWLGKQPEAGASRDVAGNFDIARRCLAQWRASGSTDRAVLKARAEQALSVKGARS